MSTRLATALLLGCTLVAPARAADPTATCIAKRATAVGREIDGVLRCYGHAAKRGAGVDAACVSRARSRAQKSFLFTHAAGGCPATVFTDVANADYFAARASVLGAHALPLSGTSLCQANKLRAAGKRASNVLRQQAAQVRRPNAAATHAAIARAHDRYFTAAYRAEVAADCLAPGDYTVLAGSVDALLDAVAGRLKLVVRQTVSAPSPVEPAHTPGSPSVPAPTNPKLLAQFGPGAELNNVTYTRWRLGGPVQQPDAIVVTVPGFGGGAGNFEALAENLILRALGDHGLVVELWGYDRRTEQLEDRAGALLAGTLGDPLVALDWYYGAELGLTLHPALAAGPNRRAVFYNTTSDVPFIADWTPLVFARDIDVVVQAARAVARNQNVFLGGHSAGTFFAARYASTDFNLSGVGPADPGYARLRGLMLFEGGGGTTATTPLTNDSLDRIEAKFDGGLFGAVRDGAPRCVDGVTPCTVANEATDCSGQLPPKCTPSSPAHGVILGLSPKVLAAAEPGGVQGVTDPDGGQVILQVDQGAPGNNAIDVVPELAVLGILPAGTVEGTFGGFLDDESLTAGVAPALAASIGAVGPTVGGLRTWLDRDEQALWPPCPGASCVTPDNGPPPTVVTSAVWGQEVEATRIDRLGGSFSGIEGANSSDWYYPISGLSVTSVSGVCTSGTCTAGNVGASCANDAACNQSVSLDSTALSIGRGRRDIENATQAANIDIPVLAIGGTNGLVPTAGAYLPFAQSIGPCTAPSCTGAPRVVSAVVPNPAFPTFGGVAGGFEVVMAEGFAHIDVVEGEDDAANPIVPAVSDFVARNVQ